MRTVGYLSFVVAAAAASGASAQPPPYTFVPAAERLTFGGIFADAALPVQAVMALLALGAVAALAVWALALPKVGKGEAVRLAAALGRLNILTAAGAPLGALAASYTLLSGFVGLVNVRPTPPVAVLAPGWAEAAMAVMLGLLASSVAVICERHLQGGIRTAAV